MTAIDDVDNDGDEQQVWHDAFFFTKMGTATSSDNDEDDSVMTTRMTVRGEIRERAAHRGRHEVVQTNAVGYN